MDKVYRKFPGKKVLVVEDNIVNQEVTQNILEIMDINVDIAEYGEKALDMFENKAYDLILMDILMPGMDGFEVTTQMRKMEGGKKRTPIVALTVSSLPNAKVKSIEVGMDDYIYKPIGIEELEKILNKYL